MGLPLLADLEVVCGQEEGGVATAGRRHKRMRQMTDFRNPCRHEDGALGAEVVVADGRGLELPIHKNLYAARP